jgi:hypothetical protein
VDRETRSERRAGQTLDIYGATGTLQSVNRHEVAARVACRHLGLDKHLNARLGMEKALFDWKSCIERRSFPVVAQDGLQMRTPK